MEMGDPGEVTRLGGATLLSIQSLIWSPHLSCKRDQIKTKNYIDGRVTPHRRVTSLIWGPPPPCKQALSRNRKTEFTTTQLTLAWNTEKLNKYIRASGSNRTPYKSKGQMTSGMDDNKEIHICKLYIYIIASSYEHILSSRKPFGFWWHLH